MANRSYLYSSNIRPRKSESLELTGLSEWNFDIPLIYQVLFSGPQLESCDSIVWELESPLAMSIKYRAAVDNLRKFKQALSPYISTQVIDKAIEFLAKEENAGEYLLLEPYEIYILNNTSLESQHMEWIDRLERTDLNDLARKFITDSSNKKAKIFGSFFSKIKTKSDSNLIKNGFDEWSNSLCYAPYPPKKNNKKNYNLESLCFEISDLRTFSWIKSIEINRKTKEVILKQHKNIEVLRAKLIDENTNINGRLNFRFNLPENKKGLTHIFSLILSFADDRKWILSNSSIEKVKGEIVLRGSGKTIEYNFIDQSLM